ncbi:MAG TPA: helix-hairpin-helix domain-containing protein [Thermoanaerobaculia bacterium]|jgi:competence protein ComEA
MHRKIILAGAAGLLLAVASAVAGDGDAPVSPAASAPAASAGKVNINQATAAQLALLPRIGEKVADRIVDYRKEHGNFARPEDLMEVKGIGEKLFVSLKPYVTVSGPTTVTEKIRAGSSRGRSSRGAASKKAPASTAPVGKGR